MMYILIAILLTGIVFVLIAANATKHIYLENSITIQAPLERVFNQVRYLEKFPEWSPFLEVDPNQKITVTGTDGTIGAQYHWVGNQGKDIGYQELTAMEEQAKLVFKCTIEKPYTAAPQFTYLFVPVGNATKVIQKFELKSGTMNAIFMWLFGTKKQMQQLNARGLQLLKASVE
ncbi:SRPBCC family protein [Croceivirga sp. JEA036]|uniref:SRPBCC family protein n=1 Tax=Croceivirga sp. JEA036 TaxID=2721162 RepID=UPI001438ADFE|nr:SRPBCC family protein [Croceivirga sp. JEA036]NJB37223.1 SRPBCC family protein [Croceivirga sp. JEA036]